jgi:hypothetical protein
MTTRTIAVTVGLGDPDRLDGTMGGLSRVVAAHYQPGVEGAGLEGIVPYLTALTLIAGLMAVWAGLCAI